MASALVVALWVLLAASASRVVRLWSLGMARSTTTLGGLMAHARSRSSRLGSAARERALLCVAALVWFVVGLCLSVLCVRVASPAGGR